MRAAVVVVMLATGVATARPAAPCEKCVLEVPAVVARTTPMLVVLHGDREHAGDAAARWRRAARASGWILLALEVPEGTSWWQDGDASWVIARVDQVASELQLDRRRMYLAGWSGGGTFIGDHAQAWDGIFAAVVSHGGGRAPTDAACVKRLPAYFLVGDRNPLHHLAVDFRRYLEGCKQALVWDLVKGGAHEAEHQALTHAKAIAILRWLAAHARPG
ncbi:MAG: PHB depolymerase family esterase [Kofleriaceae bacterium]